MGKPKKPKLQTPNSKAWLRKADAAWGAWVHARYDRCAVGVGCAGRLEAHHLISRAIRCTRHAPENGILLCSLHHKFSNRLSPHGAPLQFAAWLQEHQPETWAWVQAHKWASGKPDYESAYRRLTANPA